MTHQPLRWTIAPLEDTTVTEIVLPKKNVDSLRRLSTTTTERTGLIYAVQGEQALYFVGYHILGIGTRTNCTFDQRYQTFQHQFTVRAKEKLPTLTTVLYHNHPRPTIEEQTPEALKHIQKELQAGIFDYLQDVGKEPTTEEALAEMSRTLSPADHRATFGRIHLLLTDTATQGYDFSHINAYKFDQQGLPGTELFRVIPLHEKTTTIQRWVGGQCSILKKMDMELRKEMQF